MSLTALIPGAVVWMFQQILDDILGTDAERHIGLLAGGIGGLYMLSGLITVLRTWLTKRIAWRVTTDMRCRLQGAHFALSPDQQRSTGERIAMMTHDVDELQYGVSAIVTAFRNPLTILVLAGTAFYMAPSLAPWGLLCLPALIFPVRWGGKMLRRRGKEMRLTRSAMTQTMQEQLVGVQTVMSHVAEDDELKKFTASAESDRRARLKMEVQRVIPPGVVQAISAFAISLLLWYGGELVVAGDLDPSKLAGFAGTLILMSKPLSGISEVWSLMQRSLAALERVYETLEMQPEISTPKNPVDLPNGKLSVAWEDVVVDYGDGAVLKGLSLSVEPGEWVSIVGTTGAGKSSLIKLLWRLRDAEAGTVRLGGVDVTQVALDELRSKVSVVHQSGFLFARTIAENIGLGAPHATREEVIDAAKIARVDLFVRSLPKGYDTALNELGKRLSGGQAQRISLARALVRKTPVLVLDEATNQVDAKTEADILAALAQLRGECTVIMVAHNLSAVRDSDRIVVMDDGKVVEEGTHQKLVSLKGRYANLWRIQEGGVD